jgi:hypothetical protein
LKKGRKSSSYQFNMMEAFFLCERSKNVKCVLVKKFTLQICKQLKNIFVIVNCCNARRVDGGKKRELFDRKDCVWVKNAFKHSRIIYITKTQRNNKNCCLQHINMSFFCMRVKNIAAAAAATRVNRRIKQ